MRVALVTMRAAFIEARSRRGAFALEMATILINDLIWVAYWLIFFRHAESIQSWTTSRTLTLLAVMSVVFGLSNGLFTNARKLGAMAADGQLDAALTLPTHPLSYLLVRRINAFAAGDIVFGVVLFVWLGDVSLQRALTFAVVVCLGAIVLTSFLVLLSASAIATGSQGRQALLGFDASGLFSLYPLDFFGGFTKIALFTVLPTALMAAVPAELLVHFSWLKLLSLSGAALGFAVAARLAFDCALRRYRSGSQWTQA